MFKFQLRGNLYLPLLAVSCVLALTAGVGDALAQTIRTGETRTMVITAAGDVTIEAGGTLKRENSSAIPGITSTVENSTITNNGTIIITIPGAYGINSTATVRPSAILA